MLSFASEQLLVESLDSLKGREAEELLRESIALEYGFRESLRWFILDAAVIGREYGHQLEHDGGLSGIGELRVVDVGFVDARLEGIGEAFVVQLDEGRSRRWVLGEHLLHEEEAAGLLGT